MDIFESHQGLPLSAAADGHAHVSIPVLAINVTSTANS